MSHLTGPMAKKGSSQPGPHLANLCCYDPVCLLASEETSGSRQGTGLEEAEPAGLGASSAKVLCSGTTTCLASELGSLMNPSIQEGTDCKSIGTNGAVTCDPPP